MFMKTKRRMSSILGSEQSVSDSRFHFDNIYKNEIHSCNKSVWASVGIPVGITFTISVLFYYIAINILNCL